MGGLWANQVIMLHGNRRPRSLGVAALLAAALAAAPAAAVIKVATYTGTVTDGYDETGEFGPASTYLIGKSFVARYVYDTGLGYRETYSYLDEVYGGTDYGAGVADPILSATVTIGGRSRTIDAPKYYGYADVEDNYYTSEEADDYFNDGNRYRSNYLYSYIQDGTSIPTTLDTNFTSTTQDYSYQDVGLYTYDYTTGTQPHYAYAQADVATLTVTNGVPEPATWALMIGGFGAVGAAARRRRRVALA